MKEKMGHFIKDLIKMSCIACIRSQKVWCRWRWDFYARRLAPQLFYNTSAP